jgi:hypothetical protein
LGGDVGITADFEGKGELQLVVLDTVAGSTQSTKLIATNLQLKLLVDA